MAASDRTSTGRGQPAGDRADRYADAGYISLRESHSCARAFQVLSCAVAGVFLLAAGPLLAQQPGPAAAGSRVCETFEWSYTYYTYDPVAERVREGTRVGNTYGTGASAQAAYRRALEEKREEVEYWRGAARRASQFDLPEYERRLSRGWRDAMQRQLASYRPPRCVAWRSLPVRAGPPIPSGGPKVGPSHPSELHPRTDEGTRQLQELLEVNEAGKSLLALHPFLKILDPLAKGPSNSSGAISSLLDTEEAFRGYDWDMFQKGLAGLNDMTRQAISTLILGQCAYHRRNDNDLDLRYWREISRSFDIHHNACGQELADESVVAGSPVGRWCSKTKEGTCGSARMELSGKGTLTGRLTGIRISDKKPFSSAIRGVVLEHDVAGDWKGEIDCGPFYLQDKPLWKYITLKYNPFRNVGEPEILIKDWGCSIWSSEFLRIPKRHGPTVQSGERPDL